MNIFYVIAVLIGVWQTLRKLDVRQREPEQFPSVEQAAFEDWKARTLFAYNVAIFACFVYIPLDLALPRLASRLGASGMLIQVLGFSLWVAWIATLVASSIASARARRIQQKLGIVLESRAPQPRGPE